MKSAKRNAWWRVDTVDAWFIPHLYHQHWHCHASLSHLAATPEHFHVLSEIVLRWYSFQCRGVPIQLWLLLWSLFGLNRYSFISSAIPSPWGSLGHHRRFRNQFSPLSPVLNCPLEPDELQACPFTDVFFPPLLLSALLSSSFHCAVHDGLSQTWWTGDMTIPLQFASLYDRQEVFVWSSCLLDLGTDSLVDNMESLYNCGCCYEACLV